MRKLLLITILTIITGMMACTLFKGQDIVKTQEGTKTNNGLYTDNPMKKIIKASILLEKKDINGAINILSNLKINPDDRLNQNRMNFLLSAGYIRNKEPQKALERLNKISNEYLPDYCELFKAIAMEKIDKVQAIKLLEDIFDKYPKSPVAAEAYFRAGNLNFSSGKYDKAIDYYEKALLGVHLTFFPEVYNNLAKVFEKKKNFEKAYIYYNKIIYFYPFSPLSVKAGKEIKKIKKTKKIKSYVPEPEEIYNIAMEYQKKFKFKEALKYYKKYTFLYPKEALISGGYYNRSLCECAAGSTLKAIELLNQTVKYDSKNAAQAMYKLAELSGSIDDMKKVAKTYPDTNIGSKAQFKAGYFLEYDGKIDEAMKEYRLMEKLFPKGSWGDAALWSLGRIYYKQKLYSNAKDAFSRVSTIYPCNEWAGQCLYWEGKCAEKLKKDKEAEEIYKKVVSRYDHTYHSYRARAKLANLGYKEYLDLDREVLSFPEGLRQPFKPGFNDKYYENFIELCQLGFFDHGENNLLSTNFPEGKEREKAFAYALIKAGQGKYFDAIELTNREFDKMISESQLNIMDNPVIYINYPLAYWDYINKQANLRGIDPYMVSGLIREESHYEPAISSWAGARGLMQIMPETGKYIAGMLGIKFKLSKLSDPETNITMGTYYLSKIKADLDGNIIISIGGYNAGPGTSYDWWDTMFNGDVDEFVENIPYQETRDYVKRVSRSYWEYKRIYTSKSTDYLGEYEGKK